MPPIWKIFSLTLLVATGGVVGLATVPGSPPQPELVPAPAARPDPTLPGMKPAEPPAEQYRVRGRVLDPAGQPVAGAWVWAPADIDPPGAPAVVTTGPDGAFALPVSAGFRQLPPATSQRALVAAAPGFGPGWTVATVSPPVVVRLVAAGPPIEGRLVDASGQPVAGASVRVRNLLAPVLPLDSTTEAGSLAAYLAWSHPNQISTGAQPLWDANADSAWATTTTDAAGRFRIADLGPERVVDLAVAAPGMAAADLRALTRAGSSRPVTRTELRAIEQTFTFHPSRFEQTLAPSQPVAGAITDAATGQPLAGWAIEATASGLEPRNQPTVKTTTDATGRYALDGLPRGQSYRVYLAPPRGQPYLPAGYFDVKRADGTGPITLDHAARRGVVVRGQVTDKVTGVPVQGWVTAAAFTSNPHVAAYAGYFFSQRPQPPTAADGRFEVVLPPGPGVVAFYANDDRYLIGQRGSWLGTEHIPNDGGFFGWAQAAALETVGDGPVVVSMASAVAALDPTPGTEAITLNLQVEPGRTVEIRVTDAEGQPVQPLEVEFERAIGSGMAERWQDSPTVRLQGLAPADSRLVVARSTARRLAGSITVAAGPDRPLPLRLDPWGEVRGRIVNDDGTPRRGITLTPQPLFDPARPQLGGSHFAGGVQTDEAGRFHIVGLVPGQRYRVASQDDQQNFLGNLSAEVTVRPGEVKDLGDFRVRTVRPPANPPAGGSQI